MRIAILADIHGNHLALSAVLERISGNYDRMVVLGDVLGYFPFFHECLELLEKTGADCLKGNHEAYIRNELPIPSNPVFTKGRELFLGKADIHAREWLYGLPEHITLKTEIGKILFCHGSPWSISEYVYGEGQLNGRFDGINSDVIVMGHTHRKMLIHAKGKLLINPGSVGLPRSGGCNAAYAILDTVSGAVCFDWVEYDAVPLLDIVAGWDFSSCFSSLLTPLGQNSNKKV